MDQTNIFLNLNLYLEPVWPEHIWYTTRHPTAKEMNNSCVSMWRSSPSWGPGFSEDHSMLLY